MNFIIGLLKPYLLKPGAALAVLIVLIGIVLYIQRLQADLRADQATISADATKCANTQLQSAATVTTAVQASVDGQRINLDAAQAVFAPASAANQSNGAATLATTAALANQAGEDGPLAPVSLTGLAALRAAHGDAP